MSFYLLKRILKLVKFKDVKVKVIGTNVAQGSVVSTGDSLVFIIDDTVIEEPTEDQ